VRCGVVGGGAVERGLGVASPTATSPPAACAHTRTTSASAPCPHAPPTGPPTFGGVAFVHDCLVFANGTGDRGFPPSSCVTPPIPTVAHYPAPGTPTHPLPRKHRPRRLSCCGPQYTTHACTLPAWTRALPRALPRELPTAAGAPDVGTCWRGVPPLCTTRTQCIFAAHTHTYTNNVPVARPQPRCVDVYLAPVCVGP
jgi:hypothetical protein